VAGRGARFSESKGGLVRSPIDDANLDPSAPLRGAAYTDAAEAYYLDTRKEFWAPVAVLPIGDIPYPAVEFRLGHVAAWFYPTDVEALIRALKNALQYIGEPTESAPN